MKLNQNNSKAQYSKSQITNALFLLMEKERFQEISILEICQNANVSRTTFYRNYPSKEAIIEDHIYKLLHQAVLQEEDPLKFTSDEDLFVRLWTKESDFLKTLYKHELFPIFTQCLYSFSQDLFENDSIQSNRDIYTIREYHIACLSFLTTGLLYQWVSRGCTDNLHSVIQILHSFEFPSTQKEPHS